MRVLTRPRDRLGPQASGFSVRRLRVPCSSPRTLSTRQLLVSIHSYPCHGSVDRDPTSISPPSGNHGFEIFDIVGRDGVLVICVCLCPVPLMGTHADLIAEGPKTRNLSSTHTHEVHYVAEVENRGRDRILRMWVRCRSSVGLDPALPCFFLLSNWVDQGPRYTTLSFIDRLWDVRPPQAFPAFQVILIPVDVLAGPHPGWFWLMSFSCIDPSATGARNTFSANYATDPAACTPRSALPGNRTPPALMWLTPVRTCIPG